MGIGDAGAASNKVRRPLALVAVRLALACVAYGATAVTASTASGQPAVSSTHFICSAANSAHVPCRFSTPSGNIRCLWTPHPNNVACELLANGRAFRLRPTGRATSIRLRLVHRSQTLPLSQQIVFPESLSCSDTRTTMTCNQDFGTGAFKLSPAGSHSS